MTIAQSLPLVESHVNPEIIFPEGEFWTVMNPLWKVTYIYNKLFY